MYGFIVLIKAEIEIKSQFLVKEIKAEALLWAMWLN